MSGVHRFSEACIRLTEGSGLYSRDRISDPDAAVRIMAEYLSKMDREYVCVINMDSRLHPINYNVVSIGGIDSSLVPVSNVIKPAILSNASNIMLMHNHPSGSLEPSDSDKAITGRIAEAAKLMDIHLLDHIITSPDSERYYSFVEHGVRYMADTAADRTAEDTARYKALKNNDNTIEALTQKLEDGIRELNESDRYRDYLNVMSRFHHYSMNNQLLIAIQKPEATLVAGYKAWTKKGLERHVRKGERGITIFAPAPYRAKRLREKKDPETGNVILDAEGRPQKEIVEITVSAYKTATVFDISQIEGKELPAITETLTGHVRNYDMLLKAVRGSAGIPVTFEDDLGAANGCYYPSENRIAIKKDMSESQTLKTLIHEITHSRLHDKVPGSVKDRRTAEIEAESVAYVICQHFGIDSSQYSFGYISGWSSSKDLEEFRSSLRTIHDSSKELICDIEERYSRLLQEPSEEKISGMVEDTAEKLSFHRTR